MRYIIVDGYNVIRADPRLQSLEQVSLEHAREVLVQTLGSSPKLANDRVIAVFDGRFGRRQHVHMQRRGRVEVMYSARGQTADDLIVAQARALAGGGRVVVVSNDAELREQCLAVGCTVSGSENLLAQLPGRRPQPAIDARGDDDGKTLSPVKRGNPRRLSRRARAQRDFRF